MDEVYMTVRSTYFVWSCVLFFYMVYWGVQDILISHKCGHFQFPLEHYFYFFAAAMYSLALALSLGEIFLSEAPGGVRVFLPVLVLLPSTVASVYAASRIKSHRLSVSAGNCYEQGDTNVSL